MRTTIILAAALSVLALPALAQPYGPPPGGGYGPPPGAGYGSPQGGFWAGAPAGVHQRIDFLDQRLQQLAQQGRLSPPAYQNFHRDLQAIRYDERRMLADGGGQLSGQEQSVLWGRLQQISQKLNWTSSRH